jgi:hypothetical protein
VAARRWKCIDSCLAVNDAQTAGIALKKNTVALCVPRDVPASACGLRNREEQSSRKPGASQFLRFHNLHDARFRRDGPVPAARTRVPALVPGVNAEAKSHRRIISGANLERKAGRRIQQTVVQIEGLLTKLVVRRKVLRKNVCDPARLHRREICCWG